MRHAVLRHSQRGSLCLSMCVCVRVCACVRARIVYVRGCADDLPGPLPADDFPEDVPVCYDFPDTPTGTQTCFCSGDKCNVDAFTGLGRFIIIICT